MTELDKLKLALRRTDEDKELNKIDFLKIYRDTKLNLNEVLPNPPVAISIGSYHYRNELMPIQFGTYGNFSCIVGASKSKKTFFKSALLAGYIGGQAQNFFSDIRGHETEGKVILDIDTEQSKWDAQRVSRRVIDMVGAEYPNYKAFFLREQEAKTRLDFIEYLVNDAYKGKVGVLSIDGAADLIENVNDLTESNAVVQRLMKLTSQNNLHLMTVIHRNHDTDKPTGHLGSAILKKAETVAFVEPDKDGSKAMVVRAKYTRSFPFDNFAFDVNDYGLPYELNGISF